MPMYRYLFVSTVEGETQFTRIPRGPSSTAEDFVSDSRPALHTAKPRKPSFGYDPQVPEMFTMHPWLKRKYFERIMVMWKAHLRLISNR